ncbi:MAG: hypothetical protein WBA07_28415 [Rivularia sp. (in: cyanobacteria)]
MKPEYDFSQAEKGKFYQSDATFNFPVYLEPDVNEFLNKLAEEKGLDIQTLVNEWLRNNIQLIESIRSS